MTALPGARQKRLDEGHPNPGIPPAMSDDDLRAYAVDPLERLDSVPSGDTFELSCGRNCE